MACDTLSHGPIAQSGVHLTLFGAAKPGEIKRTVLGKVTLIMIAAAGFAAAAPDDGKVPSGSAPYTADTVRAALGSYCISCHNSRLKTAGLALDAVSESDVGRDPQIWEK